MRELFEHKASALALVAANLLPLFGVLFWDWDAFEIVALYWTENVVIGAINVLKMITCSPDPAAIDWTQVEAATRKSGLQALQQPAVEQDNPDLVQQATSPFLKLTFTPFFAVHYGFFCFVHGMFVLTLFGNQDIAVSPLGEFEAFSRVLAERHLGWAVAGLAASHLCSFFVNYLGGGEYRRTVVPLLMFQPYGRVVVLHVAILFGGWVAMALGSNAGVLSILVAGKTVLDLALHLRERRRQE